MVLLDLFCKAGGASMGYHNAGFEVVGVDICPQPNYPFEFIQMDAISFLQTQDLSRYDVIHASPPCQRYTVLRNLCKDKKKWDDTHVDLLDSVRTELKKTGKPYIIENVVGATMDDPVILYGTQFEGLYTQRPRKFESNMPLTASTRPKKKTGTLFPGKGIGTDGFISVCGSGKIKGMNDTQAKLYWGFALGGIDWMTKDELREAIPPAYTEFLGRQAMEWLIKEKTDRRNCIKMRLRDELLRLAHDDAFLEKVVASVL